MGDWEDNFGAGVDAVDVIDGINRQYFAEQRREEREARVEKASQTPFDRASGKEVYFASYREVEAWDRANPKAQFIRRRSGDGFVMKLL